MDRSEEILDAVQKLTLTNGAPPSIASVAEAVGLTKQGVLHYFPSRSALDSAVIRRAVTRVDQAMAEAARGGSPVATYLGLSSPTDDDWVAVAALVAGVRRGTKPDLSGEVEAAIARWQTMIAEEVDDPVQAEVVRLVGDALFGEALLTGVAPEAERVERLVTHLRTHRQTTDS